MIAEHKKRYVAQATSIFVPRSGVRLAILPIIIACQFDSLFRARSNARKDTGFIAPLLDLLLVFLPTTDEGSRIKHSGDCANLLRAASLLHSSGRIQSNTLDITQGRAFCK